MTCYHMYIISVCPADICAFVWMLRLHSHVYRALRVDELTITSVMYSSQLLRNHLILPSTPPHISPDSLYRPQPCKKPLFYPSLEPPCSWPMLRGRNCCLCLPRSYSRFCGYLLWMYDFFFVHAKTGVYSTETEIGSNIVSSPWLCICASASRLTSWFWMLSTPASRNRRDSSVLTDNSNHTLVTYRVLVYVRSMAVI